MGGHPLDITVQEKGEPGPAPPFHTKKHENSGRRVRALWLVDIPRSSGFVLRDGGTAVSSLGLANKRGGDTFRRMQGMLRYVYILA